MDVRQDQRWLKVKERLSAGGRIIDLGCGANPVRGASVGVDLHLDPRERHAGHGPVIDPSVMEQRGVRFVHARVDGPLPFEDKEFDFAYSHHVFEHLEHPEIACREMMRIAKSGVIITPSFFSEQIFGRTYHRWLVMDRGRKLYFFRKRPHEQTPWGLPPRLDKDKGAWVADEGTNPFDMLLNDGEWYDGRFGRMPALSKRLREYWYGHSPLLEIIFIWEGTFEWDVVE